MDLPREPRFYSNDECPSIEIKNDTEDVKKMFQSINETLKHIETILLRNERR